MARTGRPPKPLEEKRRLGNPGKRPLPKSADVVALPPADGVPPYPLDLELAGQRLWDQAWDAAITWLSPKSDTEQVHEACLIADDLAAARRRYRATTDPADGRTVVALSKSFTEALSALGFNPTARSRLGVAEVKRVSALQALQQKYHG